MHPYEKSIADAVNKAAGKDVYFDAESIMQDSHAADIIRELISWACRPTNIMPITIARDCLKAFPAKWVSPLIRQTAAEAIDMGDDWDYRRLLELTDLISPELLGWALTLNEDSDDPDIAEAVSDFREYLNEREEK